MISPCCGSSLQQGTKFLAMLSMVLSVAGIAIASISLFSVVLSSPKSDKGVAPAPPELEAIEEEDDRTITGIKLFILLIGCIFNLFLAILLFIGAEQKNMRLCQVWFKVTIFLFILDLLFFIGSIALDMAGIEDYVINTSGNIYSIYELWVVFAFMNELKCQKEAISVCPTVSTTV